MVAIILLFIWVPYMATHEPPHQNFFYITVRLEKITHDAHPQVALSRLPILVNPVGALGLKK